MGGPEKLLVDRGTVKQIWKESREWSKKSKMGGSFQDGVGTGIRYAIRKLGIDKEAKENG